MSITRQSSDALAKRLAAIPREIVAQVQPALIKGVQKVAADARTLAEASRRTGETIDSIETTGPNSTTPAYAQGGATRTTHELQAVVTVGNPDVRTAHLVEFGTDERHHQDGASTGTMPATPFLLPAWRLNRARVQRRINSAVNKAIREASQ
ncbi:HK97 gp10 family phage protein [Paracoccus sp. YIM 132242]|uniref:HK97 gp10 family phage protein n=1 Tax=Paracoccus lichenicola TaxID=2665644 RepID=A0A6L6HK71_9RHOB|nr:HK97 gp10 family phage protein [Paracoccus lichenicola]MTD98791.1 HK97 gp10 family phage protein [Paracoccus lichenicola]